MVDKWNDPDAAMPPHEDGVLIVTRSHKLPTPFVPEICAKYISGEGWLWCDTEEEVCTPVMYWRNLPDPPIS